MPTALRPRPTETGSSRSMMLVVYLSLGFRHVNSTGKKGEVLSLGFASIYHGTYVKEAQPEWLFSLTAPWDASLGPSGAPSEAVLGFGAPLCVLLLSVLGAGLLTLGLIVKEITNKPDFKNDAEVRGWEETIVRHQFVHCFRAVLCVIVYVSRHILYKGKACKKCRGEASSPYATRSSR